MKLKDLLSLEDFEDAARRTLPRPIFGYGAGSVETGASLRANLASWDELAFVPRMPGKSLQKKSGSDPDSW